LSLSYIII